MRAMKHYFVDLKSKKHENKASMDALFHENKTFIDALFRGNFLFSFGLTGQKKIKKYKTDNSMLLEIRYPVFLF